MSTRAPIAAAAVVVAAAAAALPGARAALLGRPEPSPVIFPEQRIPLSFSHRQHLAMDLSCAFCHESAAQSRVARDDLIPPEAACRLCHKIDRSRPDKQATPVAACDGCHPGFDGRGEVERVSVPEPHLRFNHAIHVERGAACTDCHARVPGRDLATRVDLPRMPECLACHDGRKAPAQCTTCHLSTPEGRVRTSYPTGRLSPSGVLRGDAHDLAFYRDHRRAAANDQRYCASCHTEQECLDCHDSVLRPMSIHGNSYLLLHAADARRNQPDCGSCHRLQSFCQGCHAQAGVVRASDFRGLPDAPDPAYAGHFDRARGVRFHPEGWADLAVRGPDHHSFHAQRNIRQCASCHSEQTCLDCHRTAAFGPATTHVSPHPPGFALSRACRSLADRNRRVCLKCHAADDARRDCVP